MVSMKNMASRRPSKKLDHRSLGPVEVLEAVGKHAFKVKLPPLALNHPVFHLSELEPVTQVITGGRRVLFEDTAGAAMMPSVSSWLVQICLRSLEGPRASNATDQSVLGRNRWPGLWTGRCS